jgi:hypothetical protein
VNIHCFDDLASKMPRILQNISQLACFSGARSLIIDPKVTPIVMVNDA